VNGGSATAKFRQACAAHGRGEVTTAHMLYESVIRIDPKHAGALHALGLLAAQTGDLERGARLLERAACADPRNSAVHNNRGLALHGLGLWSAALASFDRALELRGSYPQALYNRGNTLRALGELPAALESYRRALGLDPAMVPTHFNFGLVARELGRLDEALASFEQVVRFEPAHAAAWCNRGNVLAAMNRSGEALTSYERALAIDPRHVESLVNRSNALAALERWEEALAGLDAALALRPGDPDAVFNRGNVLKSLTRWEEALAAYELALTLRPGCAAAYFNRGVIEQELQQWTAALQSYDQAIAVQPDYAQVHSNRGNVLRELGQCQAAIASYDRALALDPDYADAHWNRGIAALLSGDFATGWAEYEWRWRCASGALIAPARSLAASRWSGAEPLANRTILVHHEQGLGDALQFCRYVSLLAQAGAHTVLETPQSLASLLAALDGVGRIVPVGADLPACDYHCPLMSLPLAFGTDLASVPAPRRYLAGPAARVAAWQARLGERREPRIGLVWSGNTGPHTARNRAVPLAQLLEFLPPGFRYLSLQKDPSAADALGLRNDARITDCSADLLDFSDTAALCECLDLLISIDTSVAHLGGALGRPTWILLQFSPDWRWLLGREDSPWYPSVRLFRQTRFADWEPVLQKVRRELLREFG